MIEEKNKTCHACGAENPEGNKFCEKCGRLLQDETEKTVLRMYYINWMKWKEIADRLGYDVRNVTRIHGRALQNFKI